MGEIVHVRFGSAAARSTPTLVCEDEPASLPDAEYVRLHRDQIEAAVRIEVAFVDYVESLEGPAMSERNMQLRREGLQQKSLQDLCTILLTSRETDWKRNPSFYAAVVIERTLRTEALGEDFG